MGTIPDKIHKICTHKKRTCDSGVDADSSINCCPPLIIRLKNSPINDEKEEGKRCAPNRDFMAKSQDGRRRPKTSLQIRQRQTIFLAHRVGRVTCTTIGGVVPVLFRVIRVTEGFAECIISFYCRKANGAFTPKCDAVIPAFTYSRNNRSDDDVCLSMPALHLSAHF